MCVVGSDGCQEFTKKIMKKLLTFMMANFGSILGSETKILKLDI
jgi:hypothetical protein